MIDPKLESIDNAIAKLQNERIARIMHLQDPVLRENREKFLTIATMLKELDDAGEAIRAHGGTISGTFFMINPQFEVEEI